MSYITKAVVSTFLNITLTPQGEALIDAAIPAVEAYAESFCGRVWSNAGNIVETFDGGTDGFFVAQPPIATIVSVVDNGSTLVADSDYYTYRSYVRVPAKTVRGYNNVVITYTSASTAIPADLKHAPVRWVAEVFKAAEDAGKTAKRVQFGPGEVEFLVQDGIPKYTETVLKRYRLSPI